MLLKIFSYIVQANSFNQKCAKTEECDQTKSLDCDAKKAVCICKETSLYWNEKQESCGNNSDRFISFDLLIHRFKFKKSEKDNS